MLCRSQDEGHCLVSNLTDECLQADEDFSPFHLEEAPTDDSPLDHEGGQQQVEAYCAVPVPLQEGHQEAEPDENHHMDVLEH